MCFRVLQIKSVWTLLDNEYHTASGQCNDPSRIHVMIALNFSRVKPYGARSSVNLDS